MLSEISLLFISNTRQQLSMIPQQIWQKFSQKTITTLHMIDVKSSFTCTT